MKSAVDELSFNLKFMEESFSDNEDAINEMVRLLEIIKQQPENNTSLIIRTERFLTRWKQHYCRQG